MQSWPQRKRNKDEDRGQGSVLGKQQQVSGLDAEGLGFPTTHRETGRKRRDRWGAAVTRDCQQDHVEGNGNSVGAMEWHVASVERGAAGAQAGQGREADRSRGLSGRAGTCGVL